MGKLKYIMVVREDGDGFMATFPELPGCMTGAKTMEELRKYANEVVRLFLSDYHDRGEEIPEGVEDAVVEIFEIDDDPVIWHEGVVTPNPVEAV